jgi:hypothetical protein
VITDGELWSAAFLRSEPEYDEPAWVDAYAMTIGRCMPELALEAAVAKAHLAFAREGDWNNPKVAAGMDALFGPLYLSRHVRKPPSFDDPSIRCHPWPRGGQTRSESGTVTKHVDTEEG